MAKRKVNKLVVTSELDSKLAELEGIDSINVYKPSDAVNLTAGVVKVRPEKLTFEEKKEKEKQRKEFDDIGAMRKIGIQLGVLLVIIACVFGIVILL